MPRREATQSPSSRFELTAAEVPRRKLTEAPAVVAQAGDFYDRYQLIHPIAAGGMATVWLARMRGTHGFERMVALKTILPNFAREQRFRNMFLDEACIASRIEHANVAQIFDLGEQDGNLYLAMEWVNGDSLSNLTRAAEAGGHAFPLPILLRIFADACAGLHAAHELRDERGRELNVVHRDVSPQNILISDTGIVKVIDFGVVKARGRICEETATGVVKGKMHYVAPERALGALVDRRADVWAVGAILYRILGGRPAYEGEGNLAIIRQLVARNEIRPLPSRVPRALARVVYRALARDPNERYASAAALQQELEGLLHRFDSPTTSQQVALFVNGVLGSSLATRKAAIDRAIERQDQTATIQCAPIGHRPHVVLVAPVAPSPAPASPPANHDLPVFDWENEKSSAVRPAQSVRAQGSNLDPVVPRNPHTLAPVALHFGQHRRYSSREITALLGACALAVGAALFGAYLGSSTELTASSTAPLPFAHVPAPVALHSQSVQSPPPVTSSAPANEPAIVDITDLAVERTSMSPSLPRSERTRTRPALTRKAKAMARVALTHPAPAMPTPTAAPKPARAPDLD